ncbi:hypothetical protein [Geopsychrobacter electrodiphilus]|uniref:hypothetical protein n=1 Tax=Geopsychrobacter electrodiphilus TaxID=225196 RepID=UPI0003A5D5A5|nr:hypothetical protein [Geopsychrobacter electrodiphilus]
MRLLVLVLLLFVQACSSGETGIEGVLSFEQKPVSQARVEFYLKSGEKRSSSPFSVATTDAEGTFHAALPPGAYYLVGKKKEQGGGVNRMLMIEYPKNPVVVKKGYSSIDNLSLREVGFEGAISADGKTVARGQLMYAGQPQPDAFVYVYTHGGALTGPAYGQVVRADSNGRFVLNLSAGSYWLAARKRDDGSRAGGLSAGDLNGVYAGNPLIVKTGDHPDLGKWLLEPVTSASRQRRLALGKFAKTTTWVSGRVVDEDQRSVPGIYLFAYHDSRMIGKPNYISSPTTADGKFRIYLEQGGEYFIGARSTFGGPLEPGEWVGTFDQSPDHRVKTTTGEATELGDILVREVW